MLIQSMLQLWLDLVCLLSDNNNIIYVMAYLSFLINPALQLSNGITNQQLNMQSFPVNTQGQEGGPRGQQGMLPQIACHHMLATESLCVHIAIWSVSTKQHY